MNAKLAIRCTLLAASMLLLNTGASAADDEMAARVVRYDDLDVTHEDGAAVLYERIRTAARSVCKRTFHDPALESLAPTSICVKGAMRRAIARVNSPALTNHSLAKGGFPIAKAARASATEGSGELAQ